MGKIWWTFLCSWQDRLFSLKCPVSTFLETGCKITCSHFSPISERCRLSCSEAEHSHLIIQMLEVYERTLCYNRFLSLSETACPSPSLQPEHKSQHLPIQPHCRMRFYQFCDNLQNRQTNPVWLWHHRGKNKNQFKPLFTQLLRRAITDSIFFFLPF